MREVEGEGCAGGCGAGEGDEGSEEQEEGGDSEGAEVGGGAGCGGWCSPSSSGTCGMFMRGLRVGIHLRYGALSVGYLGSDHPTRKWDEKEQEQKSKESSECPAKGWRMWWTVWKRRWAPHTVA